MRRVWFDLAVAIKMHITWEEEDEEEQERKRSSKWSTLEGQFTFKSAGTWILMEMAHKTESRRQKENWKTSRHHRRGARELSNGKGRQGKWYGSEGWWCYGDRWQRTNDKTGRWSVQSVEKKKTWKVLWFLFFCFCSLCWFAANVNTLDIALAGSHSSLSLSHCLSTVYLLNNKGISACRHAAQAHSTPLLAGDSNCGLPIENWDKHAPAIEMRRQIDSQIKWHLHFLRFVCFRCRFQWAALLSSLFICAPESRLQ